MRRFDGWRQSQCTLGMSVLMGPTADAQHLRALSLQEKASQGLVNSEAMKTPGPKDYLAQYLQWLSHAHATARLSPLQQHPLPFPGSPTMSDGCPPGVCQEISV